MENFKEKARKRCNSCPLLACNQTSDKFKIYDKTFEKKASPAIAIPTSTLQAMEQPKT
jgi:hypothetical protein